jgi:hypothetical protein
VVRSPTRDDDLDEDALEDADDEEFDSDEEPPVRRSEVLAAPGFGPAWGSMNGLFGWKGPKPSQRTPRRARRSRTAVSTIPEDPKARLRAITAKLDARKPRGPEAVNLLVEAAPHLSGGVTTLAQYGENRGCAREDIVAAERTVLAQSGTWGR